MIFGYYKNYLYTHRYKLSSEKKKKQVKSPRYMVSHPEPVWIRQSGRTGNRGVTTRVQARREQSKRKMGVVWP